MRIGIALSGGIDSAAAAWLLRREGHELFGLHMEHPYLTSKADREDAKRLADFLGFPLHTIDVAEPFERIITYFTDEYLRGRTPNPCVRCNRYVKFGVLMDAATGLGAEGFATGHYVRRLGDPEGRTAIYRGVDPGKDQSYVLYGIERERLERLYFPVGGFTKTQIRGMVAAAGLPLPPKRESQDVCFVPDGDHVDFVRNRRPAADTSGNFVSMSGEILAPHTGIERFTVGQRKGLGVGFGKRVFVSRIDPVTKNVVLGERDDLVRREITGGPVSWQREPPVEPLRCSVKIRYRSPARPAWVEPLAGNTVRIVFEQPVEGAAPGQSAVFYDGDRLLGGAEIDFPAEFSER